MHDVTWADMELSIVGILCCGFRMRSLSWPFQGLLLSCHYKAAASKAELTMQRQRHVHARGG